MCIYYIEMETVFGYIHCFYEVKLYSHRIHVVFGNRTISLNATILYYRTVYCTHIILRSTNTFYLYICHYLRFHLAISSCASRLCSTVSHPYYSYTKYAYSRFIALIYTKEDVFNVNRGIQLARAEKILDVAKGSGVLYLLYI